MSYWFLAVTVESALKNLRISPLRTLLALLGIAIGTAAVVSMLQVGLIAERQILRQLELMGTDLMSVEPMKMTNEAPLPPKEVNLETEILRLPEISEAIFFKSFSTPITINGQGSYASIVEAGDVLHKFANIDLSAGTLTALDKDTAPVAISPTTIFSPDGSSIPLKVGDLVHIGFDGYRIVGTVKNQSYHDVIGIDLGRSFIIPRGSMDRLTKEIHNWRIVLKTVADQPKDKVQQILESKFRDDYGIPVIVESAENLIRARDAQKKSLTYLLAAMGSIALVTGMVGVANVMLASVAERRKEIGLRMSVGASPLDIMLLFLIEAILLCLIGGCLGAIIGIVASNIYANIALADFTISPAVVVLGLAVSVLGGIAAGLYPAYRSSVMDPVKALQSGS